MLEYKKGLPNDQLRQQIYDMILEGNVFKLSQLVKDINPQRLPVDINIWATKSQDMELFNAYGLTLPTDQEFENQVQFVYQLSQRRDENLATATDLQESISRVSWFLRDYQIRPYAAGEDFLTTQAEWQSIQNGNQPARVVTLGAPKNITTLRDAAVAVHGDDPYAIWNGVLGQLFGLGVEKTRGIADPYQADFACWGPPHIAGMVFSAMGRVGLLSFRNKWLHRVARPEEFYPEAFSGFLPQAFPEGSPTHPSHNAMHSAIHWTAAYMVLELFDGTHLLPNGRTVEQEIKLLAGNMSDWRSVAGVHYMSDNTALKPLCYALAKKVVKENK